MGTRGFVRLRRQISRMRCGRSALRSRTRRFGLSWGAVWIETDQESLRLVATDSYRMAVRDLVPDLIGGGRAAGRY